MYIQYDIYRYFQYCIYDAFHIDHKPSADRDADYEILYRGSPFHTHLENGQVRD